MSLRACFDTCVCTRPYVCIVRMHVCVRIFNMSASFLTTLHSDPFLLKSAALILHVGRPDKWKYARARRRKKTLLHFMKHDDGFIAQGGP